MHETMSDAVARIADQNAVSRDRFGKEYRGAMLTVERFPELATLTPFVDYTTADGRWFAVRKIVDHLDQVAFTAPVARRAEESAQAAPVTHTHPKQHRAARRFWGDEE